MQCQRAILRGKVGDMTNQFFSLFIIIIIITIIRIEIFNMAG